MYKYYKKDNYDIMYYLFSSITEYLNYLEKQPINEGVWNSSSLSSHRIDYEWYKTKDFEEATNLAKYGCREDFDKFVELKVKLEKYIKLSTKKSKQFNDYIGYAPDVKAYLEGNPLSMLNRVQPKRKQIDIYYNSANLSRVDSKQIFNRGAVTLSLTELLESLGFNVNLNIFTMSEEGSQIHYSKFVLKNENERINIQKLFFPMCHPSWHRRLNFNLREKTPDISRNWTDSYGATCDERTIRRIIDLKPSDIVICRPDEMNVEGYNLIDDADAIFEYINRTSDIKDFKLEKIKKLD